ncbi:MAG: hypothetical protein ACRDPS_09095 [Nocardioides sp.]|uniref:hypothetical protein n=1 Tax=Nocardioides sp. TaxID=35761 RepID=UPI003D6A490B
MARIDTAEGQVILPLPAEHAWTKAFEAFERVGIVEERRLEEQRIVGIVPSGFGGMNGAHVEVQVLAAGDAAADVKVQASAQEGLIKQKTAPKAVEKFLNELSSAGGN